MRRHAIFPTMAGTHTLLSENNGKLQTMQPVAYLFGAQWLPHWHHKRANNGVEIAKEEWLQ